MSRTPHESVIVKRNELFCASVGRVKDMLPSPAVTVQVQEVMPWHDYNSSKYKLWGHKPLPWSSEWLSSVAGEPFYCDSTRCKKRWWKMFTAMSLVVRKQQRVSLVPSTAWWRWAACRHPVKSCESARVCWTETSLSVLSCHSSIPDNVIL